jgi:hypothetical protein
MGLGIAATIPVPRSPDSVSGDNDVVRNPPLMAKADACPHLTLIGNVPPELRIIVNGDEESIATSRE